MEPKKMFEYWFTSLWDLKRTIKKFKGKISFSEGVLNVALASVFNSLVVVSVTLMITEEAFGTSLLLNMAFLFIIFILTRMIIWLLFLGFYHVLASFITKKGDLGEYFGLASFPVAGIIVLTSIIEPFVLAKGLISEVAGALVFFLSLWMLVLLGKTTKEEYELNSLQTVLVIIIIPVSIGVLLAIIV